MSEELIGEGTTKSVEETPLKTPDFVSVKLIDILELEGLVKNEILSKIPGFEFNIIQKEQKQIFTLFKIKFSGKYNDLLKKLSELDGVSINSSIPSIKGMSSAMIRVGIKKLAIQIVFID